MLFRMGLRPVFVCSALLALAQAAPAQVKIAVINLQTAVMKTAEIQKADADLQAKLKPEKDRGDKLQADLVALQNQAQANGSKMTEQQQEDLQAEGQRKNREYQRIVQELQEAGDAARQDVLPKATQRMVEVVKKLAQEKGYDLVVEATVTYFNKDGMDITADATAAYDKAYPVAGGAPPAGAKPAK